MSRRQMQIIVNKAWALLKQIWPAFVVLATLIAFRNDWLQFWRDIRTGGGTWLWVLLGIVIVALWLAAWYVSRTPRLGERLQRLDARFVRWGARVLLAILPLVMVALVVWWVSPPKQTVVLVADFVDPTGADLARVTQSLVDGMRETLKEQPNIQVRRLNLFIPAEGGSQLARAIGNRPEHKAAFVIWGDYTLQPDPELHLRFDILRQTETYLRSGQTQAYGPTQVQQPTMFDFKAKLGTYLGQLTAFASGLALFDGGKNLDATPMFETAARAVDQPLAKDMERAIRFYRGTNYLILGRTLDARPDLQAVAPAPGKAEQALDDLARTAMDNLGTVLYEQGDYATARTYFEQTLALYRQCGDLPGQADGLGSLGMVALQQGDYATAKGYFEQALALHRQSGNRLGEAAQLGSLGAVAQQQGDDATAKGYFEQALALCRQFGDRLVLQPCFTR